MVFSQIKGAAISFLDIHMNNTSLAIFLKMTHFWPFASPKNPRSNFWLKFS